MSRRHLVLLAAGFVVLRLLLVLTAADRLSQPDAAEVKLMAIGDEWVQEGPPSVERLLWYARAGTNAPHGAYLPVSLAYAALVVPFGADGSYFALKLVGILVQMIGLLAWTLVGYHLGGRRAAFIVAALLALPPAGFLGGSVVPWGSHPEAAAGLGLATWALVSGRLRGRGDAVVAGGLLGLVAGADLLVAPAVAAIAAGWVWDRRVASREQGGSAWIGLTAWLLVGGVTTLTAVLWLTGGLSASVVETAGSSPLELLAEPRAGQLGTTLAGLLPVHAWGSATIASADARGALNAVTTAGLLCSLVLALWALPHRLNVLGTGVGLLLAAPLVHVLTVAALAPRAPFVPQRYLLPIWPIVLLGVALALAWWWIRTGPRLVAIAALVLALGPGAALQTSLIRPERRAGFSEYRPADWLAEDIGQVTYDEAPWVNRFLSARGPGRTVGFGFATAVGAADDPLISDLPPPLDPVGLVQRRERWLAAHLPGADERTLMHENLGWSLAVFAWDRPGTWHAVLSHVPAPDRRNVARGLGLGLALRGAEGLAAAERITGPDRAAVLEGVARLR